MNWVELKPFCIEVVRSAGGQGGGLTTMSSDAPQRTSHISLQSDPELYAWMDNVYSRCPSMGGVSNPTSFTHKVHVGFDPLSGGFTGWSKNGVNYWIHQQLRRKTIKRILSFKASSSFCFSFSISVTGALLLSEVSFPFFLPLSLSLFGSAIRSEGSFPFVCSYSIYVSRVLCSPR